jgi:hypothetical protein
VNYLSKTFGACTGFPRRECLLRLLLTFCAACLGDGAYGSEPNLKILSATREANGTVRLQISSSAAISYLVQGSPDLGQWIPLSTNVGVAGTTEFADSQASVLPKRFYRLVEKGPEIQLSATAAAPGQKLLLTGNGFDPTMTTYVEFRDALGNVTRVRSMNVSNGSVAVMAPFLVSADNAHPHGGGVKVAVRQEASGLRRLFISSQELQIAELPSLGLSPGVVTLEYLTQLTNLLSSAAGRWQTIESASSGKLDAAPLRNNLVTMQNNVALAKAEIQKVINGQTPRAVLGQISGRDVVLDLEGVAALDRMIAACLVNYQPTGMMSPMAKSLSLAGTTENPDWIAGLQSVFDPGPGTSSQPTFDMFERFNAVGGLGVGILATTAVVLGVASAPAAAALAGTAGAVLFFTAYVAPAVMGASAMSFAAPFIEVQTGSQVTLEDYRLALNHIQKGSQAYLQDEIQGRLLEGAFLSHGASEDLTARASLFLGTSKSILGAQDLAQPTSVASTAFANSDVIFAGLKPSTDLVTYTANLSETFTDTYPVAAWDQKLTATVTIKVRGQGTTGSPFSGTFRFNGTMLETLLYCNDPDGCDPGGTYALKLENGLVTGSIGLVDAEGTGTLSGNGETVPFPYEFRGGILSGDTLKGTITLGDFQQWQITLTRN